MLASIPQIFTRKRMSRQSAKLSKLSTPLQEKRSHRGGNEIQTCCPGSTPCDALQIMRRKIVGKPDRTGASRLSFTLSDPADYLGFSYGFRPGRSQHDALDALATAITRTPVNWILDADIRSFFDSVSQEWLVRFMEHRIGDQRIIRLVRKWLKAGVLEDGKLSVSDTGTPQGAVASPLLANVYLHYVFDLWANRWRRREAKGNVIILRYADDVVVGFEHEADARRFWDAMRLR